jgi:hypothetical protein
MMSFEDWAVKAEKQIASGNTPNLFRWIFIQVDSLVEGKPIGEFDITELQAAGLEGWDVVAVIPKTVGLGLTNSTNAGTTSWGAGLGGNVLGAYLILSKEIFDLTSENNVADTKRVVSSLLAKGKQL